MGKTWTVASIEEKAFYHRLLGERLRTGLFLLLLLFLVLLLSIASGSYDVAVWKLVETIVHGREDAAYQILWEIRMPRVLAAVLAGAGLGLCGCVLQNVLKNPLVSPFTLGISQGAAFGAAFAIIVLGAGLTYKEGVRVFSHHIVLFCAFFGALLTTLLIFFISSLRGATRETTVLSGIAISAFLGALTMLIQYFGEDIQIAAALFWTFGDLGKATWKNIPIISGMVFVSLCIFFARAQDLNAMKWGEDVGRSLGVNAKRLRMESLLFTSLTTAIVTSFLGIIGFVGLIAPHIGRRFAGEDERFLIPFSALIGSLLLLLSDLVARRAFAPNVLPVGIITSFFGAPFFLYLLLKARHENYS